MKGIKLVLEEILLSESVYDQGIFKAVFMAGGPGSGKSFVSSNVAPRDVFGLKVINSDKTLEYFFKKKTGKADIDMDIMSPSELEEFAKIRGYSKDLTIKLFQNYVKNHSGILIDGTGDDYEKIKKQREFLQRLGYDTYMVFVNTSLDVARARNQERERSVSDNIVKKIWGDVQKNLGSFQELFGSDRIKIVDNNEAKFVVSGNGEQITIVSPTATIARKKAAEKFGMDPKDIKIQMDKNQPVMDNTFKEVKKFIESPVRSQIAKDWIAKELEIRKRS